MATRKSSSSAVPVEKAAIKDSVGTVLATFAGPSTAALSQGDVGQFDTPAQQRLATQKIGAQAAAAAMPANPLKAAEHGIDNGRAPPAGQPLEPHDRIDTASTVTEDAASPKVGRGEPPHGYNPGSEPLDRVRVDSGGKVLTTNMGAPVADNQNSLKAGLRGPTLMEDFILREKITHFDHERIPERVVHARGSGAHGYFESYQDLSPITRAAPFAEAGKRTPVFVRFSTVAGSRGSADTVRDVRGFAVKFYTRE
ncbi:MAG: catalase, partial [Rhizobacter sp.]